MRSVLQLNKLITVSGIIFLIILNSCHHSVSTSITNPAQLAPEIIHIIDGDTASGKLTMEDVYGNSADTFKINAGESLKWLLGHNQIITRITKIYKKPTSENIFSIAPDSTKDSLNWQGTIAPGASGKTEDYNIDWIDRNGLSHTFDPKIQVR